MEIRTFSSFEEITEIKGFRKRNPISRNNYRELLGDYWLEDKVKCCLEKENGNLCKTKHNFGFVVRLTDKSASIIGNCCAVNKFDAAAKIRVDRNKYLNEKRRRQRLETVRGLRSNKENRLKNLSKLEQNLSSISLSFKRLESDIGTTNFNRLREMARTGDRQVEATFVTIKVVEDEWGETDTEVTRIKATIGVVRGISALSSVHLKRIGDAIRTVKETYGSIEEVPNNTSAKELDRLIERLNQYDVAVNEFEELESAYRKFERTEPWLFCFLSHKKSDRFKAARFAMREARETGGRDQAKQWLADKERELKNSRGADSIEL